MQTPKPDLFLLAVNRVFGHEGGFSNHPSDPGGATRFGITEQVARKQGYRGEMRFLPKETALEILKGEYWTPIRGDELPFPIAFQLFDFAVNSGPITAIKFLQKVLEVPSDGVFGPVTLKAALSSTPSSTASSLLTLRLNFLQSLSTWVTFGKGWSKRIFDNFLFLLKDLNAL